MTAVTQTEAFSKLDEGTVKDFIMKVIVQVWRSRRAAPPLEAPDPGLSIFTAPALASARYNYKSNKFTKLLNNLRIYS